MRNVLLTIPAVLLLLLSIWIVVPAPTYVLLALGVPMPEVSPVILALALVVALLALATTGRTRRVVLLLAGASAGLAAIPLAQLPGARRQFDAVTGSLPAPDTSHATAENPSVARGIAFAESSGAVLTLDIYRTSVDGLLPVVVQIYGGAWQMGSPGADSGFATALARDGYLVVSIDYRHAPRFRWPAQIDDVRAAIEWIGQHAGEYGGDPDRIALVGRSSGAQLALVAAYTATERIKAVVSIYGPTNLAEGWRTPPSPDPLPARPTLETFLGGTPADVPERYAAASPITYVSKTVPPTLLVYGARDHIVEARFGRELHTRLKAAGAASIYLEVPWAEHAFDQVPGLGARLVQPYIERFLSAHLH